MRAIGIDTLSIDIPKNSSVELKEGDSKFSFRTILGVGIIANDYDKFKMGYTEAITNTFKPVSFLEKEKEVYCNYDFRALSIKHKMSIHSLFIKEIAKYIDEIYIFNTILTKNQKMLAYGKFARENQLKLATPEFDFDGIINRISAYFPLIGVYVNSNYIAGRVDEIFVDGITPRSFDGWKYIKSLPLSVLFEGDKCNPLISTADILAGEIAYRIYRNNKTAKNLESKLGYNQETFSKIIPELKKKTIQFCAITSQHFKYISPSDNTNLNINSYLKRPMVFLFKDESKTITTDLLRKLPGFDLVYDLAFRINGSVKFFDKQNDQGKIQNGDYLIYFSPEGKKDLDVIQQVMGDKIKIISFEELRDGV